ncbi:MAG: phosphopantetheine-binding protein [Acidobacteria bacterium]|nr:phosphopantetheine-binding protein [Acidobacteriota bacterium]
MHDQPTVRDADRGLDLTDRVIKVIADTQKMSPDLIGREATFEELKFDSLDGINILFALENEFDINIPDEAARQIKSIPEMVEGIEKLLKRP